MHTWLASRAASISDRTGFVERLGEAQRLPAITIEGADLPEDVLALLDHHHLDLGGTYGRPTYGEPNAGDPIQYDELRIEHDQGAVEIVVYNRAILLFRTDSEAVRRVHQVAAGSKTSPPHETAGRKHLRSLAELEAPAAYGLQREEHCVSRLPLQSTGRLRSTTKR